MKKKDIKNTNFFISDKKKMQHIHFVGIGGDGMNGIALILLKLGYKISGSDLINTLITKKLTKLGAKIYFQHSKKNIKNIDFVVKSSAILSENIEIIEAKKKNIPILLRAEILQVLMKFKVGIAVSGTHGKTTTTSMIYDIFIENKLDPTCINGGLIKSINAYAKLGSSCYFIAEADESDSSFLFLKPQTIIITNIEEDHINNYNSFTKLKKTFLDFLKNVPLHGTAIICIDNLNLLNISKKIKCKVITYGFSKNADIQIFNYKQKYFSATFQIIIKKEKKIKISLNIPGKHNALNAAAAIACSISYGLKVKNITSTLKNFQGTCRRFEHIGYFSIDKNKKNNKNAILIDDYGHHPTELQETINTIRTSWPKEKLIMIFQPHRYTRTYHLHKKFIEVLSKVDILLILKIYSANEKFIPGADSLSLFKEIKKIAKNDVTLITNNNKILKVLLSKINENDIILIQGAGNINRIIYKKISQNIIRKL